MADKTENEISNLYNEVRREPESRMRILRFARLHKMKYRDAFNFLLLQGLKDLSFVAKRS